MKCNFQVTKRDEITRILSPTHKAIVPREHYQCAKCGATRVKEQQFKEVGHR